MNQTVQEFADSIGKHARTVKRHAASMGFSLGLRDIVPDEVKEAMTGNAPPPAPAPAPSPSPAPAPTHRKSRIETVQPVDYVHGILFGNQLIIISCAAVLIMVDAVSFGWIAWNAYADFPRVAAFIFGMAGMAVGYSAIKNFVGYDGRDHSEWMWGFGFFQCVLHLCAMEVFMDWSFFIGKIVISVGLPLGTAGLAIALKKSKV